jgi:PadR family transcriptional regulator PadR
MEGIMAQNETKKPASISLEENLKKALTEFLVLYLLSQREYYVGELTATLHEKSGGVLTIVFPYSAVYRLQESGYIYESEKRNAPDGRRRQYFCITEAGSSYLKQLLEVYTTFTNGITAILSKGDNEDA